MLVLNDHTSLNLRRVAIALLLLLGCCINGTAGNGLRGGKWELLLNSSGVVAMHMALTHYSTVIMFDQTSSGRSGYRLRSGKKSCTDTDPTCWAHSAEYQISSNQIRPLVLETDAWCSSGAFFSNGTLAQTGGYGDGYRRIRYFDPCFDQRCNWRESKSFLGENRWYATNQILSEEDYMIVVGGLNTYSYEFVPKLSTKEGAYELQFLHQTDNSNEGGDNLYPFVHLASDGNLFIFANRDSILLDYHSHRVVRRFPQMPDNGSRNYPSTGSSVMLPLEYNDGFHKVEIMVCGGAVDGAYKAAKGGKFLQGLSSCGRMVITAAQPEWTMEEMPGPRLMSDMLILPTGDILIINGATQGCAGWGKAASPSYSPYLYEPNERVGRRFSVLNSSRIARMYHSSAIILPDGRVLVAGSNPYKQYTFSGVPFPTELRVEAFIPDYMDQFFDNKRALNLSIGYSHGSEGSIKYGDEFDVWFDLEMRVDNAMEFNVYAPPFATHSISMSQRMLKLEYRLVGEEESGRCHAVLLAPPSSIVAPSGYYLLTVVNQGIPSKSVWLRFSYA